MKKISPSVAIIILNWNGFADTCECIDSVLKSRYQNFKIYVVDNGSINHDCKKLANKYHQIEVICSKKNLGYCGGNNFGVQKLAKKNYDYFLILNNDTVINSDVISKLVKKIQNQKNIVAVSPTVLRYYNRNTIESQGAVINLWSGVVWTRSQGQKFPFKSPKKAHLICGVCFLIKSKVIDRLDYLFDEDFFAYYEDVDLCLRLKKEGFTVVIEKKAIIFHKFNASADKIKGFAEYHLIRGRFINEAKNAHWLQKIIFIAVSIFLYFPFRILVLISRKKYANIKYFVKGFVAGIQFYFSGRIKKYGQ